MRVKDPVRLGRRLVIGGGITFIAAWIAMSVAIFKMFGG